MTTRNFPLAALAVLFVLASLASTVEAQQVFNPGANGPPTIDYDEYWDSEPSGSASAQVSWMGHTGSTSMTTAVDATPTISTAPFCNTMPLCHATGASTKDWSLTDNAVPASASLRTTDLAADLCQYGVMITGRFAMESGIGLGTSIDVRAVKNGAAGLTGQQAESIGFTLTGQVGAETVTTFMRSAGGTLTNSAPVAGSGFTTYAAPAVWGYTIDLTANQGGNCDNTQAAGGGLGHVCFYTAAAQTCVSMQFTGATLFRSNTADVIGETQLLSYGSAVTATTMHLDDNTWGNVVGPTAPLVVNAAYYGTRTNPINVGFSNSQSQFVIKGSGFDNTVTWKAYPTSGSCVNTAGYVLPSPTFVDASTEAINAVTAMGAGAWDLQAIRGSTNTVSNCLVGAIVLQTMTLTSLNPNTGPTGGGTAFDYVGTNFLDTCSAFNFLTLQCGDPPGPNNCYAQGFSRVGAGAVSDAHYVSSTIIHGTTPPGNAGLVSAKVQQSCDASTGATLNNAFTYTGPADLTATSITPNGGVEEGGQTFTVTGTGFVAPMTVDFVGTAPNTMRATNVVVASSTKLTGTAAAVGNDGYFDFTPGTSYHDQWQNVVVTRASDGASAQLTRAWFTSESQKSLCGTGPYTSQTGTTGSQSIAHAAENLENFPVSGNTRPGGCWFAIHSPAGTGCVLPANAGNMGGHIFHAMAVKGPSCTTTDNSATANIFDLDMTSAKPLVCDPTRDGAPKSSFRISVTRLAATGTTSATEYGFGSTGNPFTAPVFIGYEWNANGASPVTVYVRNNGVTTSHVLGIGSVGVGDVDFLMDIQCDTAQIIASLGAYNHNTGAAEIYTIVTPSVATASVPMIWHYGSLATTSPMESWDDFDLGPLSIRPSAHNSITDLTGFDVDHFDQAVVVRDTNGENVRSLDPKTLLTISNFPTSGCTGKQEGVDTITYHGNNYLSFLNCETSGSPPRAVNRIHIRDQGMNPPAQNVDNCATGYCDIDLTTPSPGCAVINGSTQTGTGTIPPALGDMNSLAAIPNDWSFGQDANHPSGARAAVGWTYTTSNGDVGAFVLQQVEGNQYPNCYYQDERHYSGSLLPSEFCGWHDWVTPPFGANVDNIAAVTTTANGPTTPYGVIVDKDTSKGVINKVSKVSLNTLATMPTSLGGLSGLKCTTQNSPICETQNPTGTCTKAKTHYDFNLGAGYAPNGLVTVFHIIKDNATLASTYFGPIQAMPLPGGALRPIAMDLSGHFVGFYNGTDTVSLYDMTNVTKHFRCNVQVTPGGFPFDLRLDNNAQILWVVRSGSGGYVENYDVGRCTVGKRVSVQSSLVRNDQGNVTGTNQCVDAQGGPDPSCKNFAGAPYNPTGDPAQADCLSRHQDDPQVCQDGTDTSATGGITTRGGFDGLGLLFGFLGLDQPNEAVCLLGGFVLICFALAGAFIITRKWETSPGPTLVTMVLLGECAAYIFLCFPLWVIIVELFISGGVMFVRRGGSTSGGV